MELHRATALRRPRRPRILLVLFALVLLPGASLGWHINARFNGISADRDAAQEVIRLAGVHLDAVRLEAAITNERNWTVIDAGIAAFGVDNDFVEGILGLDVRATRDDARADVDGMIKPTDQAVAAIIEEARREPVDPDMVGSMYGEGESLMRAAGARYAQDLKAVAPQVPNGREILDSVTYVENAAALVRAVSGEHSNYFGSRFRLLGAEPTAQIQLLIRDRRDFAELSTKLLAAPDQSAESAAALRSVLNSQAISQLQIVIDQHLNESIEQGLDVTEGNVFTSALADIDRTAAIFKWSIEAISAAVEFVGVASGQLATVAQTSVVQTDAENREQQIAAAATALATLLSLLIVGRFISRSATRLAEAAEAIHNGESVDFSPQGPAELHLAGQIIANLGESVSVATEQSLALANGALDDPSLRRRANGPLGESLSRAVDTLAGSIREREEFRKQLAHEATHDGLTGISNRTASTRFLTEALARAREKRSSTPTQQTSLAVLYVDLDGFKPVNDVHGHRVGDEMLTEVASRIAQTIGEQDFVGRLGGDEFVIISENVESADAAVALADRIRCAVRLSMTTSDGTSIAVGCSVGVALADPDQTAEAIVHDADLALYAAKAAGRDAVALCTDKMRAEDADNISLKLAIEDGITNGEFEMHYQPIVDAFGHVDSLEALIRWRRPDGSMVAPNDFIPFAERSDLIVDLDRWVLDRVAAQLAEWAHDPVLSDLPVAVNVSGRHLGHQDFVRHIRDPIDAYRLDGRRLIVEVTETALLQEGYDSVRKLAEVQATGVKIAIDDFGTGYTGLTHLRAMPIDIIKVDSEFIAQVHDPSSPEAILVRLIVETGHLLGAKITAEGVEHLAQVEALQQLGADKLQGYFFARPVGADEIVATIQGVNAAARLMASTAAR